MEREQLMQLQIIEQEAEQLNQQSQLIEQNINELEELSKSLDEIDNNEKEDFLVNIGKRIFLPVKVKEKKLIVEVGNKNLVKKSIPDTKLIIENQMKKLIAGKLDIAEKLKELEANMEEIMSNVEGIHEHGPNCKHDHD